MHGIETDKLVELDGKLKAGIPHIYEIFLYIYTQNILKYTYAFT